MTQIELPRITLDRDNVGDIERVSLNVPSIHQSLEPWGAIGLAVALIERAGIAIASDRKVDPASLRVGETLDWDKLYPTMGFGRSAEVFFKFYGDSTQYKVRCSIGASGKVLLEDGEPDILNDHNLNEYLGRHQSTRSGQKGQASPKRSKSVTWNNVKPR